MRPSGLEYVQRCLIMLLKMKAEKMTEFFPAHFPDFRNNIFQFRTFQDQPPGPCIPLFSPVSSLACAASSRCFACNRAFSSGVIVFLSAISGTSFVPVSGLFCSCLGYSWYCFLSEQGQIPSSIFQDTESSIYPGVLWQSCSISSSHCWCCPSFRVIIFSLPPDFWMHCPAGCYGC